MSFNQSVRRTAVVVAVVAVALTGCASATPEARPEPSTSSSSPAPTLTPTATPAPVAPDPLLVVSGTVADQDGQSLAITLTTTSVRPPTEQDWADYAATLCGQNEPAMAPGDTADARVVTLAVEAVGSPGFTGWTDARGVRVSGLVFDGAIWGPEQHSPTASCYFDSVIVRPGTGEARMFTSSRDWHLANPVVGDASITLASYGFEAQTHDALGQKTGLGAVADCVTTASAEFDALALDLWDARWGESQTLPEYCDYGRTAGD
jgi:hypothetical protein